VTSKSQRPLTDMSPIAATTQTAITIHRKRTTAAPTLLNIA